MNILMRWSKRRQVRVQVEMVKELMVVTINIPPQLKFYSIAFSLTEISFINSAIVQGNLAKYFKNLSGG